MKPGRLPEDHPEEQAARAALRQLSPLAQAARERERTGAPAPPPRTPPPPKPPSNPEPPARW